MQKNLTWLVLVGISLNAMEYDLSEREITYTYKSGGSATFTRQMEDLLVTISTGRDNPSGICFSSEILQRSAYLARIYDSLDASCPLPVAKITMDRARLTDLLHIKKIIDLLIKTFSNPLVKYELVRYIEDNFELPFPISLSRMYIQELIAYFELDTTIQSLLWDALVECYMPHITSINCFNNYNMTEEVRALDKRNRETTPRGYSPMNLCENRYRHLDWDQLIVDGQEITPWLNQLFVRIARAYFLKRKELLDISDISYGFTIGELVDSGHIYSCMRITKSYDDKRQRRIELNFDGWRIVSLEGLDRIPYKECIKKISARFNAITDIPQGIFDGMEALESIDLSDNALTQVPQLIGDGQELPQLRSLVLHHNKIQDVNPNAFYGLGSLTYIDMSNNQISDIVPGLFKPLSGGNIRSVYLSNNSLWAITADRCEGLEQVEYLSLKGNPITTIQTGMFDSFQQIVKLYGYSDKSLSLEDYVLQW